MKNPFSNALRLPALLVLLFGFASPVRATVLPSVSTLPSSGAKFTGPARVATDAQSRLYVSDPESGRVVVLDAFGRESFAKSGLGEPLGLAVDGEGRIYVGDGQTGAVNVYDAQWSLLRQLGQGAGEFQLPGHIAVADTAGVTTVFVSDGLAHAVKAYRNGERVGLFGSFGMGPTQFNFPAGIWVGLGGNLFVVDQNNDRVQVLDQSGNFLRWFNLQTAAYPLSNSGRAQSITGDGSGRLYVVDAFQGRVTVWDASGFFLGRIGQYGESAGELRLPGGAVLDGLGRLWVANTGNARVEGFGLDCFAQPAITPAAQLVANGATVTFAVSVGCPEGVGYQWLKDSSPLADGGIVSGATNATLILAGVGAGDAGSYSVVVTGPGGSVTIPEAQLAVTGPPVISVSPGSRSAVLGTTVNLTVMATGSGLGYRWFYNGIELFVPNTNTLVLTNVEFATAGKYWAVVTNAAGTATSAQATLGVFTLPTIAIAPTNQTVIEGGTATFSVLGNGSGPLRYQWYRGASAIVNQTNTTLTLTNVTPALNGSYYARVTNAVGATNSSTATLTVTPDTIAPVALVAAGGVATNRTIVVAFSKPVNATSAQQPLKYQLIGPGGLSVVGAVVTNASRVRLMLSGNRIAGQDYVLRIQNVTDNAYTPNLMSPNPAMLSVQVADAVGTVAWWRLDDASGTVAREATGGGFDGKVESATWTAGRSGGALNFDGTAGDVLLPALTLNTNAVTITTWLRRSGSQPGNAGIVYYRSGNSVAGVNFGTANELRYNWNDVAAAYNYNSGLVVPDGLWVFVALTIEPSRAILYLNTGTGLRSATNTLAHANEEFNGAGYFGWDTLAATRRFRGAMDDVRICNRTLTAAELQSLYTAVTLPASCAIASPAPGAVAYGPNVELVASVASNGNVIDRVEFRSDATILGVARRAPYTCVWSNLVAGGYSVRARTYFSPANYYADSATVNFAVVIPIVATMQLAEGSLTLSWSGGVAPYQVQMATNLVDPVWIDVGPPTTENSLPVAPSYDAAFYRVVGVGQ